MSEPLAVLYVRPDSVTDAGTAGLSVGPDFAVTPVSSIDGAVETLQTADPDFVVCDHAPGADLDGLDVLESMRRLRSELPILLCTDDPDGRVAAEATRLGVTEYVPRSETDPAQRLRALAEGPSDGAETSDAEAATLEGQMRAIEQHTGSLRELARLTANDSLTETETIERVLELGADSLGLSLGYLSRIEDDTYTVQHVVGDHSVIEAGIETALSNTYCSNALDSDGALAIQNAPQEGWGDHPSYELTGLACYLGGEVRVNGDRYGTICFADESPRSEPFSHNQRTFIRLLTQWVSQELERRTRERELERYADIIEAVDDGVYALDETGHFEFVNAAMTELTGYAKEQLLGAHTSEIKPPEVVDEAEGIVQEMLFEDRTGEETFELALQRADGTRFPAEDHMTMRWDDDDEDWFTGTAGVIRDITARKARERELQDANRRIEQILGRIGAAFFAVDENWKLTYWNERAEAVLGREAGEVMGESLWEMFPDTIGSTFEESYRGAMDRQEPVSFEEYYPPIERWFRVNAYPSQNGLSVYFHDITDQKERDRKLSGLLETTRSLMQARTAESVAETVIDAAESELEFDLNLVRLYDDETETLRPVAATETVPDRPVYDADGGFPGEAFQRGETICVDDFDAVTNYESDAAEAAMYVPLGEYGVLSVATTEQERFGEADVSVAEILASNAAAALARVEREQDLLRYETVVENVRDMVYVLDEDGRFQLVTEPLADWLGYDRAELLGSHPRTVLDERSVAAFSRQIQDLRGTEGNSAIKMETHLLTADGEERPAEIEVSLIEETVFRGTAGVVRDLTEIKQVREELQDERDRFSYLFNSLPDAVVETEFVDDDALVRSVNPAFSDVFGFDSEAVLDSELPDALLPPDEAAHREAERLNALAADGESVQAEIRRRTADGFRDFLFRGIPYRRDDGRVWSFGIYTDITDQKERERRLKVLNRVLRHNLRNDLTVVMGLADELYERLTDDQHRDLIARLQRKAGQISSLSDRARDIERSVRREESGSAPVDIADVVASLTARYEQQHDAAIETTVPSTTVRAADGRFGRVLDELLENSVEHAGADPRITVSVETTPDTVSVTVTDDGPGIPEDELDVLTGEEPITQLSHGSGLGLWLVIWVTQSYGGTVTFDNDDGNTAVTLALPRIDS